MDTIIQHLASELDPKALFTGLSLPVCLAISVLAQNVKGFLPKGRTRRLVTFGVCLAGGVGAAALVEPLSPYQGTTVGFVNRALRYAGMGTLAYAARDLWMWQRLRNIFADEEGGPHG